MNLFFDLMQIALGHKERFDAAPTADEWRGMFEMAKQQTLLGVAFTGVERLPSEQWPEAALRMKWLQMVVQIEQRNRLMNVRSAQVAERFLKDGYRSCILKGQGNALMYPRPLRRQSGDIDIWLDGGRTDILRYVLRQCPGVPFKFQHVEFPSLKDTEVEVHYFPMYMQNPWGNRHLQRFFKRGKEECFTHRVQLPEGAGSVAVPTPAFNAVYQLTHIFIHFIIEGIGLRHFLDYYYVLLNLPKEDRPFVVETLKRINLYRFAQAVMYVEKHVLGLEDEHLFAPTDERRGRRLVEEIMQSGNFGKYETRFWTKNAGFCSMQWQKIRRNSRFLLDYPGEIAFEPLFRLYHAAWRLWMRRVVL